MKEVEGRLIDALQPVRNLFLAQVIYFGMTSGLFAELAVIREDAGPDVTERLAGRLSMNPGRLAALMDYLAVEGIVADAATQPRLTSKGLDLLEFQPWYELLVGGYGTTLYELPVVVRRGDRYATRNGLMVGRGSCGISQYDAIPLVDRLLAMIPERPEALVDLGCGDGSFLLSLCKARRPGVPVLRGIGVDPDRQSISRARRLASDAGLTDAVSFAAMSAAEFIANPPAEVPEHPCFVLAFSLQEVLGQQGRDAVVELVRQLLKWDEGTHLAVVEVEQRLHDPHIMRHGLATAYYNPYYLLHEITEQRLESVGYWREVMAEAGGKVCAVLNPAPEVDSTTLEIGMLVRGQ